ncbi:AP endonuclease [Amanita rubescens]|nr:AP endonuclease [Amanita rubescens]
MPLLPGSPRFFQTSFLARIKHSNSSAYIMRRSARLATREVVVEPEAHDANKPDSARASKKTIATATRSEADVHPPPQTSRKRKAKVLDADDTEFLDRNKGCPWKIGAHVSSAGGVENAVLNAAAIGANAFALFLKSQRKWNGPPLTEESISLFKSRLKRYDYATSVILPHGSYLVNLGNPDAAKREKSYECFIDDLKRCEQLGLELYNFHPGSTVGAISTAECISYIAEGINRAHKETQHVKIVIENMAGSGNVIGSNYAELAGTINLVEDKSRVGVCLDSCHMFAAGYDIRTKEGWNAMLSEFDEKVGLKYLRGMHLNDSKVDVGSKRDRHENIGLGFLGIRTFAHILSDHRVQGIPLILETPSFEKPREVWGKEIQVLQRLAGVETGSHPNLSDTDERELANEVREVVKRMGGSTATKAIKATKSRTSKAIANKRKINHDNDSDDDVSDGDMRAK